MLKTPREGIRRAIYNRQKIKHETTEERAYRLSFLFYLTVLLVNNKYILTSTERVAIIKDGNTERAYYLYYSVIQEREVRL